jgi:hypothetical protein
MALSALVICPELVATVVDNADRRVLIALTSSDMVATFALRAEWTWDNAETCVDTTTESADTALERTLSADALFTISTDTALEAALATLNAFAAAAELALSALVICAELLETWLESAERRVLIADALSEMVATLADRAETIWLTEVTAADVAA